MGMMEVAAGVFAGNVALASILWAIYDEGRSGTTVINFLAFMLPLVFVGSILLANWSGLMPSGPGDRGAQEPAANAANAGPNVTQ